MEPTDAQCKGMLKMAAQMGHLSAAEGLLRAALDEAEMAEGATGKRLKAKTEAALDVIRKAYPADKAKAILIGQVRKALRDAAKEEG